MSGLLGEYECRLDNKNRLTLPSAFLKQLPCEAAQLFVINRGFEKHLMLYSSDVWETISEEVNQLNNYVKKHREFARYFFRGAHKLKLDSHNRLLLPKRLIDYAAIKEDIILFAHGTKIEIWAAELYDQLLLDEPEDFSDLAEELLGDGPKDEGKFLKIPLSMDQ